MMCWRLFRYPLYDKARDGAPASGSGSGSGSSSSGSGSGSGSSSSGSSSGSGTGSGSGSSGTGSGSGSSGSGSSGSGSGSSGNSGVITGDRVGTQTDIDKNIDDSAKAYSEDINKIFSGSGQNNKVVGTLERITTQSGNTNIFSDCILPETYEATRLGQSNTATSKNGDEIIDILTQYTWTIDVYNKSANSRTDAYLGSNIPYCCLVEYQQKTGSNILNLINTMVAGISTTKDLASTVTGLMNSGNATSDAANGEGGLTRLSKGLQNLREALIGTANEENSQNPDQASKAASEREQGSMINSVLSKGANMINKVSDMVNSSIQDITNPCIHQGSALNYLAPYSLLYSLKKTGKRYCFPMITNPPVLGVQQNDWGESQSGTSIVSSNSFITGLTTLAQNAISTARDIQDMVNFFQGGANAYMATGVEKAAFYNYPKNTEEYTITFPLINNTKKDEWKKNYKFILMFCLRNMPFRKDNSSFYPPVLYDLTIPGVIRQPYCYVNSINVRPMGLTKMIRGEIGFKSLIKGDSSGGNIQVDVAVPEAWVVTIKVKSLLATTGNLILAQLLQNDSSSTKTTTTQETATT